MEEMARLGEAFRRFENDGRFCEGIAALRSLLLTGARLREILRLQWVNADMERAMLFLPDSKTGKKAIRSTRKRWRLTDFRAGGRIRHTRSRSTSPAPARPASAEGARRG